MYSSFNVNSLNEKQWRKTGLNGSGDDKKKLKEKNESTNAHAANNGKISSSKWNKRNEGMKEFI